MVAMEIIGFLVGFVFGVGVVVDLRQRFVAVGIGVDVGISAVSVNFLKQVADVPSKFPFFGFNAYI